MANNCAIASARLAPNGDFGDIMGRDKRGDGSVREVFLGAKTSLFRGFLMKKYGFCVGFGAILLGFAAETQAQVTLNVTVRKVGDPASSIMANASSQLNYEVVGTLGTAMNSGHMGLALFGGTLDFSGGALTQANANDPTGYNMGTPPDNNNCANAMANFAKPWGITNPAGYKGTEINGDLVQFGGGQNSIKNIDSADFPVGVVKTGVAATGAGGCGPAILLSGTLTLPANGGPFTLNVIDAFANVIAPGQNGTEEFWATLAVGTINVSNLTITLAPVNEPALTAREPLSGKTLPQTKKNRIRLTFGPGNLPGNPGAGEVTIREMLAGGGFGADLSSNFQITAATNVLTLLDNSANGVLGNKKWYLIESAGTYAGVQNFCAAYATQFGDADAAGAGLVSFADLGNINTSIGQPVNDTNRRRDIDGSGIITFADMGAANSFIATGGIAVARPNGHTNTCP